MQFSTILPVAFCLATTCLATPLASRPKPGAQAVAVSAEVKANVTAQIAKWQNDIKAVNTFVDTVGKVTDSATISSMAATAFVAAQNEGASNTILQQDVKLSGAGAAAAKALTGQFNIIGPAINDTISNPQNLQKNLDAINGARCPPPQGGGAIGQEGAVQLAAGQAVGIKVAPPELPSACTAAAPN